MHDFLSAVGGFFGDMFSYAMIALFLENTVFSRAIGTSTCLFVIRKKYGVFFFGFMMTGIIALSSVLAYFIYPLIGRLSLSQYVIPAAYVLCVALVYVILLLLCTRVVKKRQAEVLSVIHVSAFNCAVLGALMLASNIPEVSFGAFLGFGIGSGLGFTIATFFVRLAYEQLSSEHVPASFRGFPITLIYLGIASLAFYGLVGHELPF